MFKPKSFAQILQSMAAKMSAETPINDYTPGSNVLTLLQAAAQEDFQQYVQMVEIVRNYNLDTTTGSDLDARAFEYGLNRLEARAHSGFITVTDTRFNKIFTKLYAGLPGPTAGSTTIYVDDASDLPTSGSIYIGRGTTNVEGPIAYSSAPVDNTSYWTINLDTAIGNDHGTDETIVLSQFGVRSISSGTEVRVPENDSSEEILFELNQSIELLDGENEITNVLVTAVVPGGFDVPRNSIREFVNPPFTGAVVSNPAPFVNGRDEEQDQDLRDRIRETIQSLSRGTAVSVKNGILGLLDPSTNSNIVSANVIQPTILADGPTKVYIDNGRGLEPEITSFGLETLVASATGGERFFQLSQFPLIKSNVLSQLTSPFDLVGGETLTVKVGTLEESFTFIDTDFETLGSATADECAQAINDRATIFEARTVTNEEGARVLITPIATQNENLTIDIASTANLAFNFSTSEVFTLKLYKNDKLLNKDGLTASVISSAEPFNFSSLESTIAETSTFTSGSRIVTVAGTPGLLSAVKPGDYVKSTLDSDLFYSKVRTVASNNKLILEAEYPSGSTLGTAQIDIWSSPQLEVSTNGDLDETELVSFSKTDFTSPSSVSAAEVLARLLKEIQHSDAQLAINSTSIKLTSLLENSTDSKMRVVGGHGALALGFSTSYSLTGTLSVSSTDTTVLGIGTSFLSELQEGQWIKVSSDNNGAWSKIETIENDTTLYLSRPYNGPTAASVSALALTFGEESVGGNSEYTLNRSNGQIELNTPLVAGDSLTAGSINTRAFVLSSTGPFDFSSLGSSSKLEIRIDDGLPTTVTTGDASAPFNTFIATSLIGYPPTSFVGDRIDFISGNNAGESDYIVSYNDATGEIVTSTGFTNAVSIGDSFIVSQSIQFVHATDFIDPAAATYLEVIDVLNSQLVGATALPLSDGSIRLRSNKLLEGKIQVLSGSSNTANELLQFSTTEQFSEDPNLGYVVAQNSDRDGLYFYPGYTLSPNQNIVILLDNDSTNKTFAVPMRIEAELTSGSAVAYQSDFLRDNYTINNYFKDFWVYWKDGDTLDNYLLTVNDYDELTGTLSVSRIYPDSGPIFSPAPGDTLQLVPRTAENFKTIMEDLNTSTFAISGSVELLGNTGDFFQIATNLPGTDGKVLVSGGTANSIGIAIQGPNTSTPAINDVLTNSIAGLKKGLPVKVTTTAPYEEVVFISDIQNTVAPFIVSFEDIDGNPIDASTFTLNNEATIFDVNGLNLPTIQIEGIDGYKFFSGLIQLAQFTIDGLSSDQSNYPGIAAAGTQFEVIPPVITQLKLTVNITTVPGVSLSSVSNDVSSAILEYVNSREVGEDVILSEIIAAAQGVTGVFDVEINNLTDNITISDGELARLLDENLTIG